MAKEKLLCVSIYEAKPNKLFTEDERQWIRFLIYNRKIPCAECGKKVKKMWTMRCQFKAVQMNSNVIVESSRSHPPLTPVCDGHPLKPDFK